MFNNEFKPTWDELAPSLQYLLKSLQSQIVGNYNTIEDYLNKIKDLEDKIKDLENANQFENLYTNGSTGQVVKVNRVERKLYPDDEFHIRLVSDIDTEIKKYISKNMNSFIADHINNEWVRYANYYKASIQQINNGATDNIAEGQNLNGLPYNNFLKGGNAWLVDSDSLSIKCNKQSVVVAGIVSPYEFSSYSFKVRMNIKTGGVGSAGVVLSYITDANGVGHNLSLVRSNKGSNNICWAIVYDLGLDTQKVLVNHSSAIISKYTEPDSGYVTLYVERSGPQFTCKTTVIASTIQTTETFIDTITYKMEKASLSFAEFIMASRSSVGLFTRNTICTFDIIDDAMVKGTDSIIEHLAVYDLKTMNRYTYSWQDKRYKQNGTIEDTLSNRVFVWNINSGELYFYFYSGSYTKMAMKGNYSYEEIQEMLENKVDRSGDTMTGSLTSPKFIGPLNGNADTASRLKPGAKINGVVFNGGTDITISVDNAKNSDKIGGYDIDQLKQLILDSIANSTLTQEQINNMISSAISAKNFGVTTDEMNKFVTMYNNDLRYRTVLVATGVTVKKYNLVAYTTTTTGFVLADNTKPETLNNVYLAVSDKDANGYVKIANRQEIFELTDSGLSSYNLKDKDILYVGTNGQFTTTEPTTYIKEVGMVQDDDIVIKTDGVFFRAHS
nr:hypothetical protein [Catenibacterium mitsuokai]